MNLEAEIDRRLRILLVVRIALLGEIPPNLRAVSVDWTEDKIILYFFFNGEPSEDDRENAECVATDILAHFFESSSETNCVNIPEPNPIPRLGKQFVFACKGTRFEP